MHTEEPGAGANLPVPHSPQAAEKVLPACALAVPGGQGRHAALEALLVAGLYVPAAQLTQRAARARLYLPASQLKQEEATLLLHVPAGQGLHAFAVPAPLKVPAGQGAQEVALGALQVPAAQVMQEAISWPGY